MAKETPHGLGDHKSGESGAAVTESRVMSLADAMLADVSRSQLPESGRFAGITTTAELAAAGITDAKIRTLVRRGVLTPVCRGAWARADLAGR
ncbi:MAG TPA: type IV toxin-antitoxin system AbiEi family antitoxin domain-containing protein, partial [Streptosporangiaceae bacterium]